MTDQSDHMREAATFAENVRRELRAHPAEVVADLTDGLESDIGASLGDGALLPNPTSYANDLLRGAGLEPLSIEKISGQKLQRLIVKIDPIWSKVRELSEGLAPAWWVLRAWVLTQIVGAIVSGPGSPWALMPQWGENPLFGLIFFIALLRPSIQWGRSGKPLHRTSRIISHSAIAIASVLVLFQEPRVDYRQQGGSTWDGMSTSTCAVFVTPDVVGLTVADAERALKDSGIPFSIFDQGLMVEIGTALPDIAILQQNPLAGVNTFCSDDGLQLIVDLRSGEDGFSTTTTTTIPKATTTIPKATTTTRP